MKWVLFSGLLVVGVPAIIATCQVNRKALKYAFALLIFSCFMKISVNFVSHENYRGPDRGYEVGLTDLVAIAVATHLVIAYRDRLSWIPFNSIWMFGYFAACCMSAAQSPEPLFASFTIFKLARAYLLYWSVYNVVRVNPQHEGLWWGLICGGGLLIFYCLKQKYLYGLYRVYGTFDHSNSIPIFLLPQIGLLMAWVLSGKRLSQVKTFATLGVLGGICGCIVFTQSRLGLILMGAALVACQFRLVPQKINFRKAIVGGGFLTLFAGGILYALPTIIERFENAPEASKQARDEFNYAAELMANDNFFGVGLNQFSAVMSHVPKYREHVVAMGNEEHAGVCHHIYWLNAAEVGYLGVGLFVLVMMRFQLRYFRASWGPLNFERSILIGLFIGLSAVHLIGFYEWALRITPVFNWFIIANAIASAIAERQLHYNKENRRRKRAGLAPLLQE
jgi:hypothetical protein